VNLTLTPRDKAILGAFLVLLVGGSWAYIRWATAPASTGRPLQPTTRKTLEQAAETTAPTGTTKAAVRDVAPAPFPTESESPAALPRRDYRFIAERNIFQPPSERTTQPTKRPSTPSRPRKATPPQPFGGLAAPPPLPPAPPPPPSSPPTQMASRPANLAATGVARIGDETYVLLENPQTRDVAFVRVGESAFGYQVSGVGENYVEVKQGDVAYRITLGEGKQERRILAAAAPSGLRPPHPRQSLCRSFQSAERAIGIGWSQTRGLHQLGEPGSGAMATVARVRPRPNSPTNRRILATNASRPATTNLATPSANGRELLSARQVIRNALPLAMAFRRFCVGNLALLVSLDCQFGGVGNLRYATRRTAT